MTGWLPASCGWPNGRCSSARPLERYGWVRSLLPARERCRRRTGLAVPDRSLGSDSSDGPGMTVPRKPSRPPRPRPPRRRSGPDRLPVEDPARQAALDALAAVRERDAYANLALPSLLRQRGINGRDAALATELCYGTCRARGLLDTVLESCMDRPLPEVDGELLDALRLGSYQLLRTRVPPHAAVGTTVDLVRAGRGSAAAGFVNAVLRRVSEQDEDGWVRTVAPAIDDDPVGYL